MQRPFKSLMSSGPAIAALIAFALGSLAPGRAFAQGPGPSGPPAGGGGSSGDDSPLFNCKNRKVGQVTVTLKPETELKDLIAWAMTFTCKNFMLDPRIVSTGKKVTVMAPVKMSPGEAYKVFLVALSTMGLTVVPKGNVLRIVESTQAKSETVPILKKGIPQDEDQVVRYVMRPSYAQAETLRQALESIKSPAGDVRAAGSMLIITDYASQVRDMMSLARAIDVPGNNEGIYTIPVLHADATTLAAKINEILGLSGGGGGSPGAGGGGGGKRATPAGTTTPGAPAAPGADDVAAAMPSKILVDDRTNTLIVVSSEAGYLRVKALVSRLDIAVEAEGGTSIRVYPLENALAEELATTLTNAVGQGQQGGNRPGRPGQPAAGGQPAAPAPSGAVGDLGSSLEGQVRVIGDKPTNSLIVMSSGRDYLAIKDVIKRLDQPRRQIFIEALILEVQLNKDLSIGTSSHGGLPINNGDLLLAGVQTPDLKSLQISSLVSATGLVGGLLGSPLANSQTFLGVSIPSYAVLFQAVARNSNSNVLSAPHIIAIDNEKAELSVGNNIPYKSGLSFGGLGLPTGATGGQQLPGSIGQNIAREKLNLTLNVTPHISSNDAVRLEIEQEIRDMGGKDPELGPTWTERKLKTQVVVRDQQSVVIGGLIQEKDSYGVTKVPLLGDIPILGYLFKYSTKSKVKTNLLILLTPYVIKDQLDLQAIRERKSREREEFVKSFATLNEMKYMPQVDYRRKRGLVEEINRAVLSVEQDVETLRAFGGRQQVFEGVLDYGAPSIDDPNEPDAGTKPAPAPDAKPAPGPDAKPPAKAPTKPEAAKPPAKDQ